MRAFFLFSKKKLKTQLVCEQMTYQIVLFVKKNTTLLFIEKYFHYYIVKKIKKLFFYWIKELHYITVIFGEKMERVVQKSIFQIWKMEKIMVMIILDGAKCQMKIEYVNKKDYLINN